MWRIRKLRKALAQSSLPQRDIVITAIDQSLADSTRHNRLADTEALLHFGSYRTGRLTKDGVRTFRTYIRAALFLLDYASQPRQAHSATELKDLAVSDKHFDDLDWALSKFEKHVRIASALHNEPTSIPELKAIADAVVLDELDVRKQVNHAAQVGQEAIGKALAALQGGAPGALAVARLWFGQDFNTAALQKNLEKLCHHRWSKPVEIKWTPDKVWGQATPGQEAVMYLGRKFFDKNKTIRAHAYGAQHAYSAQQKADVVREFATLRAMDDLADYLDTVEKWVSDPSEAAQTLGSIVSANAPIFWNTGRFFDDLAKHGIGRATPAHVVKASVDRIIGAVNNERAAYVQRVAAMSDQIAGQTTAFGTYVHELTHMVLKTQDIEGKQIDLQAKNIYGPMLCQILAEKDPALALCNADNYRLFVEQFVYEDVPASSSASSSSSSSSSSSTSSASAMPKSMLVPLKQS